MFKSKYYYSLVLGIVAVNWVIYFASENNLNFRNNIVVFDLIGSISVISTLILPFFAGKSVFGRLSYGSFSMLSIGYFLVKMYYLFLLGITLPGAFVVLIFAYCIWYLIKSNVILWNPLNSSR
jgi:hypothetical protein